MSVTLRFHFSSPTPSSSSSSSSSSSFTDSLNQTMSLNHSIDENNSHGSGLQVWDNAAFDAGDIAAPAGFAARKENQSPSLFKPTAAAMPKNRSTTPIKQPLQESFRNGATRSPDIDDDEGIDTEIDMVEAEIQRLSERLEALRVRKSARDGKANAAGARQRGRVVPAKFMECLETPEKKRPEAAAAVTPSRRRGLSFGTSEIMRVRKSWFSEQDCSGKKNDSTPKARALGNRAVIGGRAASLWPSSSATGNKLRRQLGKIEEINEARSSSLSPKPRRLSSAANRALDMRRGVKTVESKNPAVAGKRDEEGSAFKLVPKSLFQENGGAPASGAGIQFRRRPGKIDEKSSSLSPAKPQLLQSKASEMRRGVQTVSLKKPAAGKKEEDEGPAPKLKPKSLFQEKAAGKYRVVASRYSLTGARASSGGEEPSCKRRKWSLPEPGKDAGDDLRRKPRSLSLGGGSKAKGGGEGLPSPSPSEEESTARIAAAAALPKIRTVRCAAWSPRDSGRAKRVSELVGMKMHFAASPGLSLSFKEEED